MEREVEVQGMPVGHTEDVVYGRKFGMALTMDVFRPRSANGKAMIWVVSGGSMSDHDWIDPAFFQVPLRRGYTVFAVLHGSQPRFTIREIYADLHRAVRFLRESSQRFGINPEQIAIAGNSSGGHIALEIATRGGPGPADAKDPVDRASSQVRAACSFVGGTDFLNFGREGEVCIGTGPLAPYRAMFGPEADTEEGWWKLGYDISPISFVHPGMAPAILLYGENDPIIPAQQGERFAQRCRDERVPVKLILKRGQGHSWPDKWKDFEVICDWFDEHLGVEND